MLSHNSGYLIPRGLFTLMFCLLVYAVKADVPFTQPVIKPASWSTHIIRIQQDTIDIVSGWTQRFTVDTPEDSGLVSTTINPALLFSELASADGSIQTYSVKDHQGKSKTMETLATGDRLEVVSGSNNTSYYIRLKNAAVSGKLELKQSEFTTNAEHQLTVYFTAGQRSPEATVRLYFPKGIHITKQNTTVDVIGRGAVLLADLEKQSIGRTGLRYSYQKVGKVAIQPQADGGTMLLFTGLDLRPSNGYDLVVEIKKVKLAHAGEYVIRSNYSTSSPEVRTSSGTPLETATIKLKQTITDFRRIINRDLAYNDDNYKAVTFTWSKHPEDAPNLVIQQSVDGGNTWKPATFQLEKSTGNAVISSLAAATLHQFRLEIRNGPHKGYSNIVHYYSGKMDVRSFGITAGEATDHTEDINKAIAYIHGLGGGTLLFSEGVYNVRTVHLRSNVYLYVDKGAVIRALKGGDAPEATWFSDTKYRSGLSPTDTGPYADPENYLTKQDVGHHYFRNTMFFGERLDNVKIIGTGRITGNGNLVTGDRVMNNAADNRSDKMFTLKLCTNIEIGGIERKEDLWYDEQKDEPYYITGKGKDSTANMLHIDRGGHFVLLATGSDNIYVHDTYFAKDHTGSARDVYDFMSCNNVRVRNIYSKVSSDDIVKLGSDCSLGYTRKATNYRVRNIIGDTNCNLFQIGSETADDITDVCVDNIFVLGANKAGFSISTNDGGHVKDVHLNCGHTGKIHSRSRMLRTTTPFFISISNRARVLGAEVQQYNFTENGSKRKELLVTNVNIGRVDNIIINGVDVSEVYGGSSYSGQRWKAFDGTQKKATPIVAGYKLPDSSEVEGGLHFRLPNGQHTGYITNIRFNDVKLVVKGGHPVADTAARPPELGVGQYNISNLKIQPSYGLWARHVKDLTLSSCYFSYENDDSRFPIFLDDVQNAEIRDVKMKAGKENPVLIKQKDSKNIRIRSGRN